MAVADRVGEGVGNGFARTQPLHQWGCVVQGVGIGAVGVEGQAAVGSGFTCFWGKGHRIVQVRVLRLGQGSRCADLRIFGNGSGSGGDSGCVVGPADGHGQRIGGRTAVPVAGGVDEGVGDGFARAEALYQRRGVVERVGVGAVGVQGQGSVKPGLGNLGGERQGVVDIRVLRQRQGSRCGDLSVLGGRCGGCGDGRDVIGAPDGDGQGVGAGAAVPVRDGIGEHVGGGFSGPEPLDGGRGVVQRIDIRAVRIQGQGAVGPRLVQLRREGHGVVGIRVMGHGQGSRCQDLRVLGDGGDGGGDSGCVVGAVDGHGQGVGSRRAVPVRDGIGEHVGGGFPCPEPLDGGRGVVERVGVGAVGVQRQGSVRSGGVGQGREGHGVADIRVLRLGQGT